MEVTNALLTYKKEHELLLNVVDVPKYCDFYFMALTKNRPLQIAVSSNGASPTAAKYFRDECETLIPKNIEAYLAQKQEERESKVIDIAQKKKGTGYFNLKINPNFIKKKNNHPPPKKSPTNSTIILIVKLS